MLTQPSNAHNHCDPVGVGVQPLSLTADEQSREGESLAEVVIDVERRFYVVFGGRGSSALHRRSYARTSTLPWAWRPLLVLVTLKWPRPVPSTISIQPRPWPRPSSSNLVLFVRADVFAVPPLVTVVADGYFSCHAIATITAVVPFAPPLFVWSKRTLLLVDDKHRIAVHDQVYAFIHRSEPLDTNLIQSLVGNRPCTFSGLERVRVFPMK